MVNHYLKCPVGFPFTIELQVLVKGPGFLRKRHIGLIRQMLDLYMETLAEGATPDDVWEGEPN